MFVEDIKEKTKKTAVGIIALTQNLPQRVPHQVISKQVLRSGTSIGANFRSACLAKSKADYISKMKIVEEEADETLYWLELMVTSKLVRMDQIIHLERGIREILGITISAIKTAKSNR